MDRFRHQQLTLAVLLLSGTLASCQLLFPPPMAIVGSGPAVGRYSEVTGLNPWVAFSTSVPHGKAEKGILLKENGSTLGGRFDWSGNKVTFVADKGLSLGNRYDFTVAGTVEDGQGVDLGTDFVLTFYTRLDDIRPLATIPAPSSGATTTNLFQPITVTFTKAMNRASFYNNVSFSPSFKAAYTWGAGDLSCVITPLEALKTPSVYTVKLSGSASDTEGNTLGSDVSSWFSEGTVGSPPTVTQVAKTVLNQPTGTYLLDSSYTLTRVTVPSGTVVYDSGFERTWGLAITFNTTVQRSGLDSLISVDPAWNFTIPYTTSGVAGVQLVPGAQLVYGTVYTLTIHRGVVDLQGNPSTTDQIYRFKADGVASLPPSLQSIVFNTNGASPTTNTVLGDHSADYQTLQMANFPVATTTATYVDLTFNLASGASIDLASIMSHFSISATDATTAVAITGVALNSPQTVRVSIQVTRGGSGVILFKITAGLADSLGNVTSADQSWPVLE